MSWIKIQNRLPNVGEKVLVCVRKYSDFAKCDMDDFYIAHYWEEGWWSLDGGEINPSFWMLIPNTPE